MIHLRFPILALAAVFFSLTILPGAMDAAAPTSGALQAEQMLGPHRWAQAVRIENSNESSRYPETVYGTVFEFNDTLWFYTSTGTQPLKASKDRTEDYKNNLLPLLRTMERGFTSFVKLSPDEAEAAGTDLPSLKNGCVVESIFRLDEIQQAGEPVLEANLLLYSSKNTRRSGTDKATGHCVLVYQTPDGMFYIDPPKIDITGQLTRVRGWDPVDIAREIESHYGKIEIEDAFFEPFNLPVTALAQASR